MSFSDDPSFIAKQYLNELRLCNRFSFKDKLECIGCGCQENIVDTSVFGCKKFLFCEKCLFERFKIGVFTCPCKNHSMRLPDYYYKESEECICHKGMSSRKRCVICTRIRLYTYDFFCCKWCNVELDPNAEDFIDDHFYKRKFSILAELPSYKCSDLNESCDICLKSEIFNENDTLIPNELVLLRDLGCRCEGKKIAHMCVSCVVNKVIEGSPIKCTRCEELLDFDKYHSC